MLGKSCSHAQPILSVSLSDDHDLDSIDKDSDEDEKIKSEM
jgi:hypothetical protein